MFAGKRSLLYTSRRVSARLDVPPAYFLWNAKVESDKVEAGA